MPTKSKYDKQLEEEQKRLNFIKLVEKFREQQSEEAVEEKPKRGRRKKVVEEVMDE